MQGPGLESRFESTSYPSFAPVYYPNVWKATLLALSLIGIAVIGMGLCKINAITANVQIILISSGTLLVILSVAIKCVRDHLMRIESPIKKASAHAYCLGIDPREDPNLDKNYRWGNDKFGPIYDNQEGLCQWSCASPLDGFACIFDMENINYKTGRKDLLKSSDKFTRGYLDGSKKLKTADALTNFFVEKAKKLDEFAEQASCSQPYQAMVCQLYHMPHTNKTKLLIYKNAAPTNPVLFIKSPKGLTTCWTLGGRFETDVTDATQIIGVSTGLGASIVGHDFYNIVMGSDDHQTLGDQFKERVRQGPSQESHEKGDTLGLTGQPYKERHCGDMAFFILDLNFSQ